MQQDTKSLALEGEHPEEAETNDRTKFEKSLQELKDLCSHLHHAANYCEASFWNAKQKNIVVENTKEYICGAVVTVVDHIGSVSANLEYRLLKANTISETEIQIDNLKQRLGTWEQFSHLLALTKFSWNAVFPRYYSRYILPHLEENTKILSPMPAKATQFQIEEVPLFLYTYNCKPSLVEISTFDESSEKRKSFSPSVLPVRDSMSILPLKDQHPNFHFQVQQLVAYYESPKLKRSMLNWKLSQNKDLRSIIRGGKRTPA